MNDTLRLVQYLYDEADAPAVVERRLMDDVDLRREYRELRATKEVLDEQPARSPDAAVVDRVVARAGAAANQAESPASPTEAAPDRPARTPARDWTRRLQGASAALAMVLLIGLGVWALPGGTATQPAGAPADNVADAAPSADADGPATRSAQALPDWDSRDELVRLNRRIERLRMQEQAIATWQPAQARP